MNAMLYVRGRPLDYDAWEAQGAPGWGYRDVLPYFVKSEDNARGASEFHGAGGPLRVSEQRSPRPMDRRLLQACAAAGIPRIADYNGPEQDGASMFQVTQRNGQRFSAADAFLRPALEAAEPRGAHRRHACSASSSRAIARSACACARAAAASRSLRAEREVMLSAGAINSPQLLLLSGIGPADELRAAGVQVRHDLPGVGRNLQDHPFVTVIWEVSTRTTLYGADKPKPLAEWLLRRSGKLSSTVAEVVAFTRTRGGLPAADIQFHMGAAYYEDHGAETYDGHCMVIAPVLVSPEGARAGVAALGRPDGQAAHHHQLAVRARRRASRWSPACSWRARSPRSRRCARRSSQELKPGADDVEREELEADLRRRLMLIYHPVGTARMSDTHEQAVVDSQLRVHGLRGPARDRRVGHAADPRRQHQRARRSWSPSAAPI